VQPLGFRFDAEALIVDGVAHRRDCEIRPANLPDDAVAVAAAGIYRSERCPRECPLCRPSFETLLSYQLEAPTPKLAL
jgi:hypothetical protein